MESQDIPMDLEPVNNFPAMPQNMPQDDMFQRQNDLRVIQEYNREENMPDDVKRNFWALASKSIKLGFWDKEDEEILYFMNNNINVGWIMSRSKNKYTFADRQQLQMLKLLVHADYKRGVGMEKYKINERVLQATSIQQSIQGGQHSAKQGGVLASIGRMFG